MIDAMTLSNRAAITRKRLGADAESPIDIMALVHSIDGLTLVLYPLGRSISGVCTRTGDSAVIAINSGMTYGRQRFTLAHELYHYYFGDSRRSVICPSGFDNKTTEEKEADLFASYLLMPPAALESRVQEAMQSSETGLTTEHIVMLEQHFGVSRHALLVRLQQDGKLSSHDAEEMMRNVQLSASRLGYDTSLYKPTPQEKSKRTYGHYVRQAENLLRAGAVSEGKYEQWLLEAFRDDVVFGYDSDGGEVVD